MTLSSVWNLKIKTRDGLDLGPFSTSEVGNVQLRGPEIISAKYPLNIQYDYRFLDF